MSRGRWNTFAVLLASISLLLAGFTLGSALRQVNRLERRIGQPNVTRDQPDPAVSNAVRISRPPTDLPEPVQRKTPAVVRVEMETVELDGIIADDATFNYWTFNRTVPGPMIRVREGDTVELHLKNSSESKQTHNIDLHAVNGPGGGSQVSLVAPGEAKAFRFKALNPGLYIYHCAAPHIPTHIAMGMYGLILVEPEGGLPPVDTEFYIVQSEFYTSALPGERGHIQFSSENLAEEEPQFVVFNGQFQALTGEHGMKAAVGDRVRLFIGNAGPNLISSFHVIGEIFDVVLREAGSEAVRNIQTTLLPAGGAAWVEFTIDVPGEYLLVDHSITRAIDKGALAVITATGPENPEVFDAIDASAEKLEQDSGYEYKKKASPD